MGEDSAYWGHSSLVRLVQGARGETADGPIPARRGGANQGRQPKACRIRPEEAGARRRQAAKVPLPPPLPVLLVACVTVLTRTPALRVCAEPRRRSEGLNRREQSGRGPRRRPSESSGRRRRRRPRPSKGRSKHRRSRRRPRARRRPTDRRGRPQRLLPPLPQQLQQRRKQADPYDPACVRVRVRWCVCVCCTCMTW